ncbi:MAG: tRNA (adenosine(37)-N6)-threonylcarbamoyltransferase complex ATPase subunit type 1 TsaE [Rickettsiales bacterium]
MSVTSEFRCFLETPEKTADFAAELASLCQAGDCILLYGDIGVGKTTFARGFIRKICESTEEIVSPTFTLVQTYPAMGGGAVWHLDLYRLKHQNELLELGLEEAFNDGIILIEWPEIAVPYLPETCLTLRLEMQGQGRIVIVSDASNSWGGRLINLQNWEVR